MLLQNTIYSLRTTEQTKGGKKTADKVNGTARKLVAVDVVVVALLAAAPIDQIRDVSERLYSSTLLFTN